MVSPPPCTIVSLARNPPDDVLFLRRSILRLSLEKMYKANGFSLNQGQKLTLDHVRWPNEQNKLRNSEDNFQHLLYRNIP